MSESVRRPLLRSQRLLLRPAERDDLPLIVEWLNDADFRDTLGGSAPVSLASEERWFDELQAEQGTRRWHFLMCRRDDGRPIGFAGLGSVDLVNGKAELGIGIGDRSLWDQGFGAETMGILLDFAFGELRLHRVYLDVLDGNDRARHLYRKVGFAHEGTLREAEFRHGRAVDVHVMGILRHEWEGQERPRSWELD